MIKVNEIEIEGNPDCATLYEEGFVVSTYNLDKETGLKTGSLQYFEQGRIWKCELDCGVLDTKAWHGKLFSCCSDGRVSICEEGTVKEFLHVGESCLSFLHLDSSRLVTCGLDGFVHVVDLESLDKRSWKLNPYEIWYVACEGDLAYVPVSIGKLMIWDMREERAKTSINLHESEISSILLNDFEVYCGSFDGTISTTDLRMNKKVKSQEIGGGVWRMSINGDSFITANMEEGFKRTSESSQSTVPSNSLAYGLLCQSPNSYLGCSYYDSKLIFLNIPNT